MKVSIYTRPTINGRRQYVLANKNSKGPFFLRYEEGGKRLWQSAGTNTWTFALAAARNKEAQLLLGEAKQVEPKPSPAAPKSLKELRGAFIAKKQTTRKKDLKRCANVTTTILLSTASYAVAALLFMWRASRWVAKTEDAIIATVNNAKRELELLRTNHLHHVQATLDEMNAGNRQHYINEEAHQTELIQAINGSKDAIVNALLAIKK